MRSQILLKEVKETTNEMSQLKSTIINPKQPITLKIVKRTVGGLDLNKENCTTIQETFSPFQSMGPYEYL